MAMCILSANWKKLSWRGCLPRSQGFACYLFYNVSLTFSRKTYCVAQIFWSQLIRSLSERCLLCFHWVLVASEENLHKRFFASHPVLYHYKTPLWKDQPVLPFLSEAAAGTNITSHQLIIISQMNLRCWICCACLVLCIQCISTGTMHTIGKHTTFIIDWYESI